MKKMGKKGALDFGSLPNVAMTFLVIGLVFAIALVILAALQANTSVSSNSAANSAVAKTITAVSELPNNWLLIIAIVIAAAIVIGIVMSSFAGMTGGRQ